MYSLGQMLEHVVPFCPAEMMTSNNNLHAYPYRSRRRRLWWRTVLW